MIARRHLLATALALGLPAPVVRAAVARRLAVTPPDAGLPAPVGWRVVTVADPIAAVLSGDADAAFDGHPCWRSAPPALLCFGGLPGGLSPEDRDGWLAAPDGRALWDALHARAGLHAVVLDGGPAALIGSDGPLAPLGVAEGPVPTAPPALCDLMCRGDIPVRPGGADGRLRLGDGSAGVPRTLSLRRGIPAPVLPPLPRLRATSEGLPLDWRVALANAAAAFVDALAGDDDALVRATATAFRTRSAASAKNIHA